MVSPWGNGYLRMHRRTIFAAGATDQRPAKSDSLLRQCNSRNGNLIEAQLSWANIPKRNLTDRVLSIGSAPAADLLDFNISAAARLLRVPICEE
jgi:hypothetical protein